MGKANTSVNRWLRDNHRFASLYNGYVFGGRQIIRPEELEDLLQPEHMMAPTSRMGRQEKPQK